MRQASPTRAIVGLLAVCLCGWPLSEAGAGETYPPLVAAARSGDGAAARAFIARGDDVGATEVDGTTALHWAARNGDAMLVTTLLESGADPATANRYGVTPLQVAAINGDMTILSALLAAGADPNAVLPEGETVLMTAARTGVPGALTVLIDHGATIDAREHWYGESALIWAVVEDNADAVRVLLQHDADVDSRSAPQELESRRAGQSVLPLGSWTPLMYAARENALAAAAVLIENGADPDLVDPDGATALVIAIINANYELAASLLDGGADPNVADDSGMGPLYAAVDMHRLAVGHGRPNPKPAGALDSVDIVRRLLERGADPNSPLRRPIMQRQHTAGDAALGEGATPFLRAAKSGDIELMRLLLMAGANPTVTMPNGSTALMYAAGLGWRNGSPLAPSYDQGSETEAVEALGLLLELGLDINASNVAGDRALHAAISGRGSAALIRFLLGRGADPSARNERGQTPLDLAESRSSNEIVALLRAASGQR